MESGHILHGESLSGSFSQGNHQFWGEKRTQQTIISVKWQIQAPRISIIPSKVVLTAEKVGRSCQSFLESIFLVALSQLSSYFHFLKTYLYCNLVVPTPGTFNLIIHLCEESHSNSAQPSALQWISHCTQRGADGQSESYQRMVSICSARLRFAVQ